MHNDVQNVILEGAQRLKDLSNAISDCSLEQENL